MAHACTVLHANWVGLESDHFPSWLLPHFTDLPTNFKTLVYGIMVTYSLTHLLLVKDGWNFSSYANYFISTSFFFTLSCIRLSYSNNNANNDNNNNKLQLMKKQSKIRTENKNQKKNNPGSKWLITFLRTKWATQITSTRITHGNSYYVIKNTIPKVKPRHNINRLFRSAKLEGYNERCWSLSPAVEVMPGRNFFNHSLWLPVLSSIRASWLAWCAWR